jgi:hypothetical protein
MLICVTHYGLGSFLQLIAYFGSRATSLAQAERRAMQYFWWFMVLTAFTGPMLAYWVLGAVNKSQRLGEGLREVLIRIAGTTPTLIAANWLNWIIYRFTIILPINFLLQFNTFLFSFLGLNCCSRLTIGGGPGGPVPYRIFVGTKLILLVDLLRCLLSDLHTFLSHIFLPQTRALC